MQEKPKSANHFKNVNKIVKFLDLSLSLEKFKLNFQQVLGKNKYILGEIAFCDRKI